MRPILRQLLHIIDRTDALLSGLSAKLVRWTGKASQTIHPKHLVNNPHHFWYIKYIQSGDNVLDIGAGSGAVEAKASALGASSIGVDIDMRILRRARASSQAKRGCISFVQANAEVALPFRGNSFEKVALLDVIEHLDHRIPLLRETVRLLKPDGLVFISAPNRDNGWKRRLRAAGLPAMDRNHKIEYVLEEFVSELRNGGLEVVEGPFPTVLETPLAGVIDFIGGISLSIYSRLQQWKIDEARRNPGEATGWRVVCRLAKL